MRDIVAKFTDSLPSIRQWVEDRVYECRDKAPSVSEFGFDRFHQYFEKKLLTSTKVVVTDRLPVPPLSHLGIDKLSTFESDGKAYKAITLGDVFFVKTHASNDSLVHFHELIHVLQWKILGINGFLIAYGVGLCDHGYWDSPLEVTARKLTDAFNDNRVSAFDAEAKVRARIKDDTSSEILQLTPQ